MINFIEDWEALIFDLDGTLVDTMPLHYKAYSDVFRSLGLYLNWTDYVSLVGPPAREAIALFIKAAGGERLAIDPMRIHVEKKAAFERQLAEADIPLLPAAHLLEVANGRVPCALVSSGNRRGVDAIIAALGWEGRFAVTVSGDDVLRGKPDPEPYLLAAEALGVAPQKCAAFEDTPAGLKSARAAGMKAFDVTLPGFAS